MIRFFIFFLVLTGCLFRVSAAYSNGVKKPYFIDRPEVEAFIEEISLRHGFEANEIRRVLAQARYEPRVIKLIQPPEKTGVRSWQSYRSRFLDQTRIDEGLKFWKQYRESLVRAERQYGVPAEIIVAVIGVETVYGRYTGNFEALSALATLAFDYPRRAPLFRRELEQLFVLAREQGVAPDHYRGSYAGALGYAQFLPSSIRHYAIDFDGDGKVDLISNPVDAIGSVANYLSVHGWQRGQPVAERAVVPEKVDPDVFVAAGLEPVLQPGTLAAGGILTPDGRTAAAISTLVNLDTPGAATEYWFGYRNFYVITRYNHSSFYAMSVFLLAEILRGRQEEGKDVTGELGN